MATEQPLQDEDRPLTGDRKAYFENLRKEHVPRYLFRAWSNRSGGGPECSINSTAEIVPRGFMPRTDEQGGFYEMPERLLRDCAQKHFSHRKVLTGYSSWAASLHLVLCYASSMDAASDPHVAVMETHDLDSEVLVWQCPHLLGEGEEEYLAWGCVRGRGYKAVCLKDLRKRGVIILVPQLGNGSFRDTDEPFQFEDVALLFGKLFLPVFAALLCLQPRPWLEKSGGNCLSKVFAEKLAIVINRAGAADSLNDIRLDNWLRPDTVDTAGFPEVRQWIVLQRALVQYQVQLDLKKAQQKPENAQAVLCETLVQKAAPALQLIPKKAFPTASQLKDDQPKHTQTKESATTPEKTQSSISSVPETKPAKLAQQYTQLQSTQPTVTHPKKMQPKKSWKKPKHSAAHIIRSLKSLKRLWHRKVVLSEDRRGISESQM
ncbi:hypothetical protein EKO04_001080 [Ascochyta lentis]|uniref:DUF7587 domain-containing protein n=1 Tax=Ascochyta lentis TaxID=205686 RepID=A0A8H7JBW2_9PLEO|nr:hypothetical protein EKO04_001080 [Ascochyta lentis]